MIRGIKRIVALVLCCSLTCDAAVLVPLQQRPSLQNSKAFLTFFRNHPKLAAITDEWLCPHASPSKPFVVLIQDLHSNVSAQRNLAGILQQLSRISDQQ